jgi:hypothetical protein
MSYLRALIAGIAALVLLWLADLAPAWLGFPSLGWVNVCLFGGFLTLMLSALQSCEMAR